MMAGNAIRQRMLQFEATKGNHGPVKAAEMAKLLVPWSSMPGNQHETVEWAEHVSLMTEMVLGEACPVNQYLNRILFNLRQPQLFVGWMEGDWKGLIWSLHLAYWTFMAELSIHPCPFYPWRLKPGSAQMCAYCPTSSVCRGAHRLPTRPLLSNRWTASALPSQVGWGLGRLHNWRQTACQPI
jgi:hypothetical protein